MASHGSVPGGDYPDVERLLFAKLYRCCRERWLLKELRDALIYEETQKINDCLTALNLRGYSLLHEAVEADNSDAVQIILQHGHSVDIQGKGKQTPLHLAASKGFADCVRALLEAGADITLTDEGGHSALVKAERSRRRDAVVRLLKSREIVYLVSAKDIKGLEKLLISSNGLHMESRDIDEALLQAVLVGATQAIPLLVLAGARRLDSALTLAMQQEQERAIAILLLCKATITGDCQAIRSLLSEPADTENAPWFMQEVQKLLSQGTIRMDCPIAVSIMEKKYEATRELLLRTDLDMRRKTVDWSRLKLTILHPSWVYSIAPWVVNLKLKNNHLRKLPIDLQHSTQLRRLDLSHNLLETIEVDLFSLPNLEYLNLSNNKLIEISESTKWTPTLNTLDLSHNNLRTLPSSIQDSSLEILNLSKNMLTTVPKALCRIRSLTTLDLSAMAITSLPNDMALLDRLANLNLAGCVINDIPPNMNFRFGPKGLFKARNRTNKPCNYIKLIVLCSTNTARGVIYSRLRQSMVPHNSHLSDMEQFQWSHKGLRFKLFNNQKLYFNTWMVSLSREYSPICSCIYTSNALYMLVWDMTRTGDINHHLKPYINNIQRYFPAANILVIVILPDPLENWLEANSTSLSKKVAALFSEPPYQSLRFHGLVFTSSSKESTLDIRGKVYDVASSMPIGSNVNVTSQLFPENYYQLVPIIESEHAACRTGGRPGILDENGLWRLIEKALGSETPDHTEVGVITSFLKEAGYLLNFEDPNQRLDQFYFIHPEWIISTFHRLLQHLHHHHTNKPVVSYSKLNHLLKLGPLMAPVIRLMVRFAIILPINSTEYLTPSLLPPNPLPLAIRQNGCYRRQLMPKGKAIPEDFWYYLITHILFQISHIMSEEVTEQAGTKVLCVSDGEMSSDSMSEHPKEQSKPLTDSLELTTGGDCLPQQRPRALLGNKQDLLPALKHSTSLSPEHNGSRSLGSPVKSPTIPFSDPVEIDPGVFVWRTGILVKRGDLQFGVYSQVCELSMDERGVEICASEGAKGRCIMAKVCWCVEKLLEQRFPQFFSSDVHPVNQGLTQIILCPRCVQQRKHSSTSVTNFVIETCFVSIKEEELPTHNCHHHSDPIPLADLIPEYLMVDLPEEYHLNKSQYHIPEGIPVHRDSTCQLFKATFNKKGVLAKKLMCHESRPLTIPLSSLRQEMILLANLNHPNIIRTFGFSLHPHCVLLEQAPLGTLLHKLMDNEQSISRLARFNIARQVASALQYLHRQGIIYRTLKADSILTWSLDFEDDPSVKLSNFDRAECISPSGLLGRAEFSSYPAPEMVRYSFREEYTEKVDIYSFGILLYELVARWQPFASERMPISQRPKLTGLVTYGFQILLKLMKKCWDDDPANRPSSTELIQLISQPSFQCHYSSQMLRDCISVRGCCFVPTLRQVWVYGEYNITRKSNITGETDSEVEGTQVFIVNADNLTVQGSLELKERANAIYTVDSKVWVGMLEACIHVYDSSTFHFTDRIHLKDSVTVITTNDTYTFVGQANGLMTYYEKVHFPKECANITIGRKAIICMVPLEESLWVTCGHEIVVLAAEEEVRELKRWDACETKDQICALVYQTDNSVVWSAVRGSLNITCWSASNYDELRSVDLVTGLKVVCCDLNLDPTHLRIHSFTTSQDTLWVGLQNGVIVVLSGSAKPEVISWFKAHVSATRCMLEIPCTDNSSQLKTPVVLSGGFGEHDSLCSICPNNSGVIMSWQSLTSEQFRILGRRREFI